MTECPTCNLSIEAHSKSELMECCMKQVGKEFMGEQSGICPNCKHKLQSHLDQGLAKCAIEFLKSGIR